MAQFILFYTAAVIGFDSNTYQVNEGDGVVTLVIRVLDGTLSTDVVVRLVTVDGEAQCKLFVNHLT